MNLRRPPSHGWPSGCRRGGARGRAPLHSRLTARGRTGQGGVTDLETAIKLAIYSHFAETGLPPSPQAVAARAGTDVAAVLDAYPRLCAQRVLVLEADGSSIRMAPPFSGVPTQHRVEAGGVRYFANCAWDALAVPAALHRPGTVSSRCEQSLEPLRLEVGLEGPGPSDWLFHCLVPAAQWWDDIVFT